MFKEAISKSNKSKSEILALGFRGSIKSTSTCSILEKAATGSRQMSQVEIYQSTDKQTQVHVTFEDESIHGTSGTLAPEGCTKVVREDTNQGRATLILKPKYFWTNGKKFLRQWNTNHFNQLHLHIKIF